MARPPLPQLVSDRPFLADGGLETALIFHRGIDLPYFAAFPLLDDEDGRAALEAYFRPYLALAREHATGFVLDTVTWRANPDWAALLGYDAAALAALNGRAVDFARGLAADADTGAPVVVCGVVGPRGDGYVVGETMRADEARGYHALQIEALAAAGADMIAAVTMTYPDEAVGIVRAAAAADVPVAVSFTVETNGRLPSAAALADAVAAVDDATGAAAAYFMVNCAHPDHIVPALEGGGAFTARIAGIRANASRLSHAELDEALELDTGNPTELGELYRDLDARLGGGLRVAGGCCGTDDRHVARMCTALLA